MAAPGLFLVGRKKNGSYGTYETWCPFFLLSLPSLLSL